MKVVFLHGIGDGDPDYGWLEGLNRGLIQAGHKPVEREQVIARGIAPFSRLKVAPANSPTDLQAKDDTEARQQFERRQARVERLLRVQHGVRNIRLQPNP